MSGSACRSRNEFGHDRGCRTCPLTACRRVNSSGCCRKCSIRRSSSAVISHETGTSDGCASRSLQQRPGAELLDQAIESGTFSGWFLVVAGAGRARHNLPERANQAAAFLQARAGLTGPIEQHGFTPKRDLQRGQPALFENDIVEPVRLRRGTSPTTRGQINAKAAARH